MKTLNNLKSFYNCKTLFDVLVIMNLEMDKAHRDGYNADASNIEREFYYLSLELNVPIEELYLSKDNDII